MPINRLGGYKSQLCKSQAWLSRDSNSQPSTRNQPPKLLLKSYIYTQIWRVHFQRVTTSSMLTWNYYAHGGAETASILRLKSIFSSMLLHPSYTFLNACVTLSRSWIPMVNKIWNFKVLIIILFIIFYIYLFKYILYLLIDLFLFLLYF